MAQSDLSADLVAARGGALLSGLVWGAGIAAAGALFGGWRWGYGGSGSYVNVNASRAVNIDRNFNRANIGAGDRWQHQVDHRRGVAYRDPATSATIRPEPAWRGRNAEQFRGRGAAPGGRVPLAALGVNRPGAGGGGGPDVRGAGRR